MKNRKERRHIMGHALALATPLVATALVVVACTSAEPTLTPTATPTATATAMPTATTMPEMDERQDEHGDGGMGMADMGKASAEDIAAGQALYLSVGCGACHGQEAEGSTFAPAMAGHTAEEVMTQVRTPLKNMPAFSESQLSDADLALIVAYITSLEGGMAHVEPLEMEELLAIHHWLALLALDAGNMAEAVHHVGHIIELVTDPDHEHQMEKALEMLQAGELHEAEHIIEAMLAGAAQPELTLEQLHLRLAHTAIQGRDVEDAIHHMNHFLETASGMDQIKGQGVMGYLNDMDLHEAGHAVEEMMGLMPHGGE